MMNPARRILFGVVCFFALCLPALAQNDRASITGRVNDSTGANVVGAAVKVTNINTGATYDSVTNEDGRYVIPSVLQVGVYRVEASKDGFKTAVSEQIELRIGDVRETNLTLQVGAMTEKITVTATAPLLDTETSSQGSVIEGRQITELPLRDRNFTNLALLTPGVNRAITSIMTDSSFFNQGDPNAGGNGVTDNRGDTPAARFGRSGGSAISANGLRPGNNNFTLDGVDNNEPIFGEIGVFPNPDAIQEFRVETSMAKAEAGRGGAQINTTYKAGTNDFHGTVSYYGQNTALNATNPGIGAARFLSGRTGEAAEALLPKTTTHINEFGATIGGPIIKNKLFFFGDYLGQRNLIPTQFETAVPTAGARDGDFSAFTQQLVDPGTGGAAGFPAGTPFPGNVIPNLTSRADFDPIAQAYLNEYPLPNVFNPDGSDIVNASEAVINYIGVRRNKETINSFDVKGDYRFSDKNTLSGRFTRDNQTRERGNFFPVLPTAGFGAGNELGNTRQVVVTDTHVFRPNLLNEFRFGYTKVELGIFNCGVEGACGISPSWCDDIGIPNCNKGTPATTGGALIGFGGGNPPGEIEFTGDGGIFLEQSKSFYIADSVSYIRGKHTWKGGIEIRPRIIDQLDSGGFGDLKGAFAWGNGGVSNGVVGAGHTGVNEADALLSVNADFSNSGTVLGGDKPFSLKSTEYSVFIQDDWKATPDLTLNLGLRWDMFPLYGEDGGRIANFDPQTLALVRATGSGNSLTDTRHDNFGPRVGFAYAFGPQRQFAVRGGIGTFFALEGFGGDYPLVLNPPNVNQIFCPCPGQVNNFTNGPPVAPVTDPPVLTTGTLLFNIPKNLKNETIYEANLSLEYQFAGNYLLQVGYAGTRSRHLLAERELGANGNGLGSVQATNGNFGCGSPVCFFNDVRAFEGRANAYYDSLQAKLEKRYSMGFVATIAYTYSHNIDNSSGLFGNPGDQRGQVGGPINALDFRADRSDSALDHRHTFVSSVLWDLPFGHGKRFGADSGTVVNKVIGGWQWNVIFEGSTGSKFSVISNGRPANQIGPAFTNGRLDPNGFDDGSNPANPESICYNNLAGNQFCYGNSGRNRYTGPGYFRTDMSFFKNLSITERVNMQIGLEGFNIFNQANALVPNATWNNPGTGQTAEQANPNFGIFQNTWLPPRIIQYRARIIF